MSVSKMNVQLSNGRSMPSIGFGTYQIPPGHGTRQAVETALQVGYRLIDTAAFYRNESDVGEAVRTSGIPRDEIFITTKLKNADQGYEGAIKAVEKSLKALGTIDLYLIHWPDLEGRMGSWKAITKLYREGRLGAIGVSNYMEWHLSELLADCDVVPMVDQVEMSPFLQQRRLREFCSLRDIVVEAYSPLARGHKMNDRRLKDIAKKHDRTPAQVMLRWCIQSGAVPLPKSTQRERMVENFQIFDFALDKEDMEILAQCDEGFRVSWDPTKIP